MLSLLCILYCMYMFISYRVYYEKPISVDWTMKTLLHIHWTLCTLYENRKQILYIKPGIISN